MAKKMALVYSGLAEGESPDAKVNEIVKKMAAVRDKVFDQFGMLTIIPLGASVSDILQGELWRVAFLPQVFFPAYCDMQEQIPTHFATNIETSSA